MDMVWAVSAIRARITGKQEEMSNIRPGVVLRVMMACMTFVMYGGGDLRQEAS